MKRITVVTPCYNEEENVQALYEQVRDVFARELPGYEYDHLFIDNSSKDKTVAILKQIAAQDKRLKLIVNTRNFGHIRSPYHALLQAQGDAVVLMAADLQDPPAMIPDLVRKWESGYKIAIGVKVEAEESPAMFAVRKMYYNLVAKLADIQLHKNATGFGIYDQAVIATLRKIDDPYPYFRGLISDMGYETATLPYKQPLRRRGITKNNFYTLYDIAMLGITNHSKIPLRLAAMAGFAMSLLSLLIAIAYFFAKLIFWNHFGLGTAPIVIGLFFFSSVQLFFIGILGEYIGSIQTQVMKRPLVIEKERVNF